MLLHPYLLIVFHDGIQVHSRCTQNVVVLEPVEEDWRLKFDQGKAELSLDSEEVFRQL